MDTTRPRLTPEQALQFAPDASAAQNAQKLAKPGQWQILRCQPPVIWGEIQGSALYKAAFDLDTLEFKCSCPSRKQPCKHGLALVLSWAQSAERFEEAEPGGWVSEWLAKRQAAAEKKSAKLSEADNAMSVDEAAQAKRLAAREKKVQGGIHELQLWLDDLMRGGLAHARTLSGSHFDHMSSRLVDAQAPGLAVTVQELASSLRIPQWQKRAPHALGRIALILETYQRQAQLSPGLQADARALVGWQMAQEDVLASPPLADDWLAMSHRDGNLETGNGRYRRQWLWGRQSKRAALLLSFAFGSQSLSPPYPAGLTLPARLCWYPSATPYRALVRDADPVQKQALSPVTGFHLLTEALEAQATQLALNPLLTTLPWLLSEVTPLLSHQDWYIRDREGQAVPVDINDGWALLALSGGEPLTVFGEWNGQRLQLLNAWRDEELLT